MRKQLIGTICLGVLSVIGLVFWEPPVQAAGENKTVEIVPGPAGPVVRPEPVEINARGSITWVPKKANIPHQIVEDGFENDTGKKITEEFNRGDGTDTVQPASASFPTAGVVIKYHCAIHPTTMHGTITVK